MALQVTVTVSVRDTDENGEFAGWTPVSIVNAETVVPPNTGDAEGTWLLVGEATKRLVDDVSKRALAAVQAWAHGAKGFRGDSS